MKKIHEINFSGSAIIFQQAVDDFAAALKDHKTSEGQPAPIAHPEVEKACRLGAGNWEYVPTPIPEPIPEPAPPTYKQLREAEYPAMGDMIDAMAKALEGDASEFDQLQVTRTAIKSKYPKPV
ncbi:MAG: hypothetical protein KAI27_05740 [Rhodospirillaceae bacterium]|nr:hypothetical protein [Rhodospirillaceae bacterium]